MSQSRRTHTPTRKFSRPPSGFRAWEGGAVGGSGRLSDGWEGEAGERRTGEGCGDAGGGGELRSVIDVSMRAWVCSIARWQA